MAAKTVTEGGDEACIDDSVALRGAASHPAISDIPSAIEIRHLEIKGLRIRLF
jgi:hypothetical protein